MFRCFCHSVLGCLCLHLLSCGPKESPTPVAKSDVSPYHAIPEATFVGAENCRTCHEPEFASWKQSDHHLAMNPATPEFVLGDFNDVTFEHFGQVFRFFRKGEQYWVNAPDSDGVARDMQIDYTFGHKPLQQYLIPFPDGRYQALQVCWDSRPASEGGQRWYHLYPDEPVPPQDVLHWTRRHFNWNYMCADCHSTNLDKGYDVTTQSYHTTWSEMNVSCEACHGPGSVHVAWAEAESGKVSSPGADLAQLADYARSKGLVVTLKEPGETEWPWGINATTGQPERLTPLNSTVQVETCARCHSHRTLIEPVHTPGEPYADGFQPSVLRDALYHHDGQMDEEVYVYGSFVQSKMYHAGVRCTDCHDPHTMKLAAPGNALCVRCHTAEPYNTPAHHFHSIGSTGASCVECHMPHQNYMVIDARRDHSIRIPRPDLAAKTGAPDACTQCHTDQTQAWAAGHFTNWWGKGPRNAHYGEILAAARAGGVGSMEALMALASDLEKPGIVRATAVETLGQGELTPPVLQAIRIRMADADPAVRIQALAALESVPGPSRATLAAPLLADPLRSVRAEAARLLAPARGQLSEADLAAFDQAAAEFRNKQAAIADRGAGHHGIALFEGDLGNAPAAEAAYRLALAVEPEFIPSRINLAELLYGQNRMREAEEVFRAAPAAAMIDGDRGVAHEALARFLIRQKRYEEGLAELAAAVSLMPRHAATMYFYGVALNSLGRFPEALPVLQKAHEIEPRNVEYLIGLATVCRDGGKSDLALGYAQAALALQPDNPQLQQLVGSLGG